MKLNRKGWRQPTSHIIFVPRGHILLIAQIHFIRIISPIKPQQYYKCFPCFPNEFSRKDPYSLIQFSPSTLTCENVISPTSVKQNDKTW